MSQHHSESVPQPFVGFSRASGAALASLQQSSLEFAQHLVSAGQREAALESIPFLDWKVVNVTRDGRTESELAPPFEE
jgi:hypothetical protein